MYVAWCDDIEGAFWRDGADRKILAGTEKDRAGIRKIWREIEIPVDSRQKSTAHRPRAARDQSTRQGEGG